MPCLEPPPREGEEAMICWGCEQAGGDRRHDGTVHIVRVTNEDGVDLGKHPLCENCRDEMAVYKEVADGR